MVGQHMVRRIIASFLIVACIAGCALQSEQTASAIEVARDYVKQTLPNYVYVLEYEAIAIDRGAIWVIAFQPYGVMRTGGAPEIYVEKKSLTVKGYGMSQ